MKNIFLSIGVIFFFTSCDQVIEFVDSFTSTVTTPNDKVLKINLPESSDSSINNIYPENTVTILVYGKNGIYGYTGDDIKNGNKFSYAGKNSLNNFLQKIKKQIPENKLFVMIKPDTNTDVSNTVRILDQMTMVGIKKYALFDITGKEEKVIKRLQQ